jgi:hypothetical protein
MYYPAQCNTNIKHNTCQCNEELARVRGFAMIHKSFYSQLMADPEDSSLWLAGMAANLIIVLPKTAGEAQLTPITNRGFGYSEEMLVAYKFDINVISPDYIGNVSPWNMVSGSRNYYIAWRSETLLRISDRPAMIMAINPIINDNKKAVNYLITAQYTHKLLPTEYTIPDGIFQCEYPSVQLHSFDESWDNSFDSPDI